MYSFHFLEIQKRIEEELAARVSKIFYFDPIITMRGWVVQRGIQNSVKYLRKYLNGFYPLNIFSEHSILDISQGPEYASDTHQAA